MSRWDAVGCDEDAEQIRGSPPFHETGSGCLPNFSHLGNVPTVPCRSRQVRGELRQSLSGLTCHFPHPPNGVTAIGGTDQSLLFPYAVPHHRIFYLFYQFTTVGGNPHTLPLPFLQMLMNDRRERMEFAYTCWHLYHHVFIQPPRIRHA